MTKIFLNKFFAVWIAIVTITACTDKFEEINSDPNNPIKVSTSSLMANAQKGLVDDLHDEWAGARQSYLYAQYFAQPDYTEESRYQLRQNNNNTYWTLVYGNVMDLVEVIRLNEELGEAGNVNEIAAARIMKVWAMQILTDMYGDIPYFEAFKPEVNVTPEYTAQASIYEDLIKELSEASQQLQPGLAMFPGGGDLIYGGDASKWKKFANSLKMRVAIRMSKVNPEYMTHIQQAITDGVFESNQDNAIFRYLNTFPNIAPLHNSFFIDVRNDFTLAKPFVDLLKGANDVVNGKVNPFQGMFDPRLTVWAVPNNQNEYAGMPYGLAGADAEAARQGIIDLKKGGLVSAPNLGIPLMDYAEVCFIRSEIGNWSEEWYKKGVQASLERWRDEAVVTGTLSPEYDELAELYVADLPAASEETVSTQKHIALFLQGYEAWAELRRTNYPSMVIRPGDVAFVTPGGTNVKFVPLVGNDIPNRLTYPISEQTLNQSSYSKAVARIERDELGIKLWWDK